MSFEKNGKPVKLRLSMIWLYVRVLMARMSFSSGGFLALSCWELLVADATQPRNKQLKSLNVGILMGSDG